MTSEPCLEMRLLIQADLDGELSPAEAARVAAHVASCDGCAAVQTELSSLSARIRDAALRHTAPDTLRRTVRTRITRATGATGSLASRRSGWRGGVSFGAGLAVAAALAFAVLLPRGDRMADAVVTDHIRALQPGHLIDVVSSDQHTVKPWFDGRIAFAPPVKDLASQGFPLAGGRLDYLAGREVAALIYRGGRHVIELFIWPEDASADRGPPRGGRSGYNFIHWDADGMSFWAVSDLNPAELANFVRLWRAHP